MSELLFTLLVIWLMVGNPALAYYFGYLAGAAKHARKRNAQGRYKK